MQTRSLATASHLVLLLSILTRLAFGQAETGSIAGTVTDQSGAVIGDASITVRNLSTNAARTTLSSSTGDYTVVGLEPATYEITVTAGNFKPFSAKVEVAVGRHVTVAARLSVRATITEVHVVAEGGAAVNTQTQELSQIIDTQQLVQLPSLARNPYDFISLVGNVSNGDNTTSNSNSGQNILNRGVGYSLNGQRESGTEILLDGVENINVFNFSVGEAVPVDAVQEYNIVTNNYTAEYGRASGGVVNVTTKPGSNEIHGTAWGYNRLSAYTANTYNNDVNDVPKGHYTRNQFGYMVGGPIIKNKLFVSMSTEWTRVRSEATETQDILDPSFLAMLPTNAQAYFKAFATGAYPASGRVTTAGQLNAAGYPINNINGTIPVPAGTPVFDTVNFTAPFDAGGDDPQNTYRLVGRVDYDPTDKTQMFFRIGRESVNEFNGSYFYSAYPQYDVGISNVNQSYLYSLSHTFAANLFGSMKFSFTRFNDGQSFNSSLVNVPNLELTPPNDPVTQNFIQLPGLANVGGGSGSVPSLGPQNTLQVEPDLAWNKGRHMMRFGGQFTYIQLNITYSPYAQAEEQLGWALQDSLNDLVNAAGTSGGSQLVSYEAGVNAQGKLPCVANPAYWTTGSISDLNTNSACAMSSPLTPAGYGRSYRYNDWAMYAQDSFKVLPRLTINYGLRYEHYGVQHDVNPNLDSNFYFGAGPNILEQIRNGGIQIADKSPIGQMYAPSWGTLAPRVGFAFDPFGNGRTSIRGGFGIGYERDFANILYNASFTPPATAVLTSTCQADTPTCNTFVTNSNLGTSQGYLPPVSVQMIDPNIKVAQTQFWSIAFQRKVANNSVLELSYSGAHGVHLYDNYEVNMVGAGQFFLGDPLSEPLNRPNDQYSVVWMHSSEGTSHYKAFNVKFQTQNIYNTGLTLVANYTLAQSLDDLSSTASTDSLQGELIASYGYLNFLTPKLDWGPSDYDVRHRFVVSPMWNTPWLKTGSSFMHRAFGGWALSGIFTIRSGTPFSIFDFSNVYNDNAIPRLTPATPITSYHVGSPQQVGPNEFTALTLPLPASFAPLDPALGISDYGPFPADMTHRNAFRGPGSWNLDSALTKSFKVTERIGMQLRAEGFDVLNHHNYYVNTTNLYYDGPTTVPLQVTELKGGLGSSARGGNHDERRFLQLALRVNF